MSAVLASTPPQVSQSYQGIFYDSQLQLLICSIHGFGLHPTQQAVTRHLRQKDHACRGDDLKQAVASLLALPLRSLAQLLALHHTQPIRPPIPHLKILEGWSCNGCNGCDGAYLTTSLELAQRHAASAHGRSRGDPPQWETCELQTLFYETKDRQYFRVSSSPSPQAGTGINCRDSRSNTISLRCTAPPIARLAAPHPLTSLIEQHVQLPTARIDALLRSNAFRTASEPLFDSSHIDADLDMCNVFPGCMRDAVFIHALVYSMLKADTRGLNTVECLKLHKRLIEMLNAKLSATDSSISPNVIGAIMVLRSTAYKFEDTESHTIHSNGLLTALQFCESELMTAAAKRALFWQDVFAPLFVKWDRKVKHTILPQQITWERVSQPDMIETSLPVGFARIAHELPDKLLDCVLDILEMQTHAMRMTRVSYDAKNHILDSMQASIECRLQCTDVYGEGPEVFPEATRLAVFMCSYCTWMQTWNDSYMPCKMADSVMHAVQPTLSREPFEHHWQERLDLLLWLLLVSSCITAMDQGHVEGLAQRSRTLISSAKEMLEAQKSSVVKQAMHAAMHDFIYCREWLVQRCYTRDWLDFELWIRDRED